MQKVVNMVFGARCSINTKQCNSCHNFKILFEKISTPNYIDRSSKTSYIFQVYSLTVSSHIGQTTLNGE